MSEREEAIRLANRVLDKPHIDPDGDVCMLARQFLREIERREAGISEKVALWMIERGYATGHGDRVEDMLGELEARARDRAPREDEVSVPLDDLLFAYRGLLVLRTMLKKIGADAGVKATDEIIARLGQIAPALPGLSALRASP